MHCWKPYSRGNLLYASSIKARVNYIVTNKTHRSSLKVTVNIIEVTFLNCIDLFKLLTYHKSQVNIVSVVIIHVL